MAFVYFVLWLALNGRVTAETVVLGLAVSFLLSLFMRRLLGSGELPLRTLIRLLPDGLFYLLTLIWEIFAANLTLIRIVLSPKIEVDPCLVRVRTRLSTDAARVALANSVTLTPGTLTVAVAGDELLVHALSREMAQALTCPLFTRILRRMEEKSRD